MSRDTLFIAGLVFAIACALFAMAAEQRHEASQCAALGANASACMDASRLPH
jgi:hypothetical protein